MSLSRIPLTFLVCWAFKKCITPPNPPAAKSERLITNFMEIEWYVHSEGNVLRHGTFSDFEADGSLTDNTHRGFSGWQALRK